MRRFLIISCHMVNHPAELNARSVDLIEDKIQEVADSKAVRQDRPAIGPLTFKHFPKSKGYEVHAFFKNKDGKTRRFMKTRETNMVPFRAHSA